MNIYISSKLQPPKALPEDKVFIVGSFDPDDLVADIGSVDGTIFIEDLTVLCERHGKTLNWDRSWPIIDGLLSAGNKIIFTSESIELGRRQGPAYNALKGVYEAMTVMGNRRGEKYKQSMLEAGAKSGGWILPDEEFLKNLVMKVKELGVKEACNEMKVSRQTYYRWKKEGKV